MKKHPKKTKIQLIELYQSFVFSVCMLISIMSFGQSIEDLDKFNGFGNFKLGTTINLHKSEINYTGTDKEGLLNYTHNNPQSVLFLKRKPTNFRLQYYEGKLYDLFLSFNDFDAMAFKSLLSELTILFGEPTVSKQTMTGNYYIEFQSSKVRLSMQCFRGEENNFDRFVVEFKNLEISRILLTKKF